MGFFQGTEELVRNSRGKRPISVRAIEVLLYIAKHKNLPMCGVIPRYSHFRFVFFP